MIKKLGLLTGFYLFMVGSWMLPQCAGQHEVIVVVGAAGEPEFGEQFSDWAKSWQSVADENTNVTTLGLQSRDRSDHALLQEKLNQLGEDDTKNDVWLVLIGHGTFDGETAKFNLKGKDFTATELNQWLEKIQSPTMIINCSSCSSPFINKLTAPNRIVISATKSGYQYNFARFGQYLATAIGDETIDLDKDGQTSLLEAFIAASSGVKEFYDSEGRLSTEQALLDDNADGKGTPADWFVGTRVAKTAKSGKADGLRSNQVFLTLRASGVTLTESKLESRNQLEAKLEELRKRKSELSEDDYYLRLEEIMVQLAKIYRE